MENNKPVYGIWDTKILNFLHENKDEWFSANKVSEHFNITFEDALIILKILERGGSAKKKSTKNGYLFKYIF